MRAPLLNLPDIATRLRAQLEPCVRRAPHVASAALGALVIVQAAAVARSVLPLLRSDAADTQVEASALPAPPRPRGLEQIAHAHLFGEASASPPSVVAAPVAPPATSLDLTLTGTLLDAEGAASQAIIADGRTERTYRAGDTLESGVARLYAVYADRVVIERDGRFESLLPRDWEPGAAPPPVLAAAALPTADSAPLPEPAPMLPYAGVAPAGTAAERLRAPGESPVASIIRFQAYSDGGVVGLRASPGRDSQTFRDLGLKAGDVITGVNGTALGSRPNGSALVQALRSSAFVNVSVVRDGVPQVLTIPAAAFGERLAQR